GGAAPQTEAASPGRRYHTEMSRVIRENAESGGKGTGASMSITAILGPGGAIARGLPNYEVRPQQLAMAEAVARAIAERRHLMVEAATGVGKSFAYLVPAVQAALASKECRVVVSTHTISLQEQLIRKDIPFLQSVMPDPF